MFLKWRLNMRYLLTTIAIISFSTLADDHKSLPKPNECEGSPAHYYVATLNEGGTIEGWLNAAKMHQAYYKERGFDVKVIPSIHYLPSEDDSGPRDEVFRISTHVIHANTSEQERWWDWNQNERNDSDIKARDAFVAEYDKNNEVVARRFLCMLID